MQHFTERLTVLFEQVEPQFRADTVARYRLAAENSLRHWLEILSRPEPPRDRRYRTLTAPPEYVAWDGGLMPTWEGKVAAAERGEFRADIERAERHANASVDYAKLHFITKQSKKLANATKLRTDRPLISGKLVYNVLIEGVLSVTYPNKDSFTVKMSMIVNHRYERGHTSFYQFPARFTDAKLGGHRVAARLSEKWMSEHFK